MYNSWGEVISLTGTAASTIGTLNPFRYRGYVYDEETRLYYLQSRYYDPELCRFISSDVLLSTGQGVLGCNAFVYCRNASVMRIDSDGFTDYIYISRTEYYTEDNDDSDRYFAEIDGVRYVVNSIETVTLKEWNSVELDFLSEKFYDIIKEADKKETNISRVLKQSIGGELDFKYQLDENVLYSANGILYNRNEMGNFIWAYYLYSHGFDGVISGILAQAGSIVGEKRLDEAWDMKARHAGISYYKSVNVWSIINES